MHEEGQLGAELVHHDAVPAVRTALTVRPPELAGDADLSDRAARLDDPPFLTPERLGARRGASAARALRSRERNAVTLISSRGGETGQTRPDQGETMFPPETPLLPLVSEDVCVRASRRGKLGSGDGRLLRGVLGCRGRESNPHAPRGDT